MTSALRMSASRAVRSTISTSGTKWVPIDRGSNPGEAHRPCLAFDQSSVRAPVWEDWVSPHPVQRADRTWCSKPGDGECHRRSLLYILLLLTTICGVVVVVALVMLLRLAAHQEAKQPKTQDTKTLTLPMSSMTLFPA